MADKIVQLKDKGDNLYPIGVGGYNVYSTSETVIGKWIDGKPIYAKVINCGAGPNNTAKSVSTGLTYANVTFVSLNGMVVGSSYSFPINNIRPKDALASAVGCYVTNTSGTAYLTLEAGADRSGYTVYVTITYTKNT